MPDRPTLLVCSCEDTMPLDGGTLKRACRGADVVAGRQLCRAELERFRTLAASGVPLTVGCTQEAPLFRETAGEVSGDMRFVNLRETAGWSTDAGGAGPKMAALAAAASLPMPEVPFVQLESAGVLLVYGRDERAIEAACLLKDALDVTVLISRPGELAPPRTTDFPIVRGTIRAAKGHLGAFDLVVDDYAVPLPSSRAALTFGPARDGAVSHCDVVIDAEICAGCGQCAAACPTGAASYALPPADALLRRIRTLLMVYRDAGGISPVLLLHDEDHGGGLIDALARHGDGLPANVLPLAVNEVTQIGLEAIAASFAYGAAAVRVLLRERPRHDLAGLSQTIALGATILAGLGLEGERVAT